MILTTIDQINKYLPTLSAYADIFEFVLSMNKPSYNGKIEYKNGITVAYSKYETKEEIRETWEQHRKYIDVHIVLEGCERIGLLHDAGSRIIKEYSEPDDVEWVVGDGDYFRLSLGVMAIIFPGEAHQPGLMDGSVQSIRKAVVKIPEDWRL